MSRTAGEILTIMRDEENIAVYEALRQHILEMQVASMDTTRMMYTIYFAVLSVGIFYNWMFPVTFVVLIVFQSMVNSNKWEIQKASAYIEVFFETRRRDIHWELLHRDPLYKAVYKGKNHHIGWYIRKWGTTLLAVISLGMLSLTVLSSVDFLFSALTPEMTLQLALSALLFGVVVYVNGLYFRIDEDRELVEAVTAFHRQHYPDGEK